MPAVPGQRTAPQVSDGGEQQAIRTVWACVWTSTACMLLLGSHLWYTASYYGELAVSPRTDTEALALRAGAVISWSLGALWIWLLLRARHAVTLGVMLTMVSQRALGEVGGGPADCPSA